MSHPLPKHDRLGDPASGEATRYESGTRRAASSNSDSERPTLPIPRSGGLTDRASVDASPKEGSLADLVAKLEPARPPAGTPVVEEAPVGACPTRPSLLLPTALDPQPAADAHDETPGQRFKRTRRHRQMARARWRARAARPRLETPKLPRARRNVVVAVTVAAIVGCAAIVVGVGRSGSPTGASAAPGRPVTSQAISAGPATRPAASEASPSAAQVEPALDGSDTNAKPASPKAAPAPVEKGARPRPSRRSNDVDFGI